MKTLGIIGGMGARAGLWLAQLLIDKAQQAGAKKDSDFPSFVLYNLPVEGLDARGVSDWKRLKRELDSALRLLMPFGCDHFLIACNSAHCFMEDFENEYPGSMIDMVTLACQRAASSGPGSIGVISSQTTKVMGLYEKVLAKLGRKTMMTTDEEQEIVNAAILEVISGTPFNGSGGVEYVIREMTARGAEQIILGCTELPLLIRPERLAQHPIDAGEVAVEVALKLLHG